MCAERNLSLFNGFSYPGNKRSIFCVSKLVKVGPIFYVTNRIVFCPVRTRIKIEKLYRIFS